MKPLTIDELKALEVGDWVWISDIRKVSRDDSQYVKFTGIRNKMFCFDSIGCLSGWGLDTYNIEWLAYKNKEFSESKSEWVDLPCRAGDTIYLIKCDEVVSALVQEVCFGAFWRVDRPYYHVTALLNSGYKKRRHKYLYSADLGHKWFTDKSEAERRLAELKGEKS